ncbi:MAG: cytochrome c biogenesis protein CcsA [Gammaproteobacteria bacterium]|nr:cytochrome c biogenesis protein CcsA [Gammaproteobacteria bacterium]
MNDIAAIAELPWLYAGLGAYALATFLSFNALARGNAAGATLGRTHEPFVLGLCAAGVLLLAVALAERWLRIGHGPFVNLFELLISQLFSLGLVYTVVYWRLPMLRPTAVVVLPAIWVLGVWVLLLDPTGAPYPPTYHNKWLWAHVGFGKFFLAFCLVGSGLAGIILLRGVRRLAPLFRHMPSDSVLDTVAWRFMLLALVFDSLMLIAGAVWAQDAWGRYWAWDALETSAFLNWLLLGASIHARATYRIPLRVTSALILVIFVFAFLTYFGTPFYSEAAHKGVI